MATTPVSVPSGSVVGSVKPATEDEILRQALSGEEGDEEFQELVPGLTKELETELTAIVNELERESYPTWRLIFRELLEAESFWKDIQQGFYDYETDVFRLPTLRDIQPAGESGMRFQFVTNLYRTMGWTVISILGQKAPTTVFLPSDYTNENDVAAARTAGDVVPVLERNNRLNLLHMKACYYLFTGGLFAGYTRYIADGEKFGWNNEDTVTMSSFTRCPSCGEYGPVNDISAVQTCPACGAEIPPEQIQTIEMPTVGGQKQTPKGQEVITLHGGLELRLPPWVQLQEDMPYLGLCNEVHKSVIRAIYGKRGENIEGGFGSEGPFDNWDRFARMALLEPTVGYYSLSNVNLVTLKRYWLRRKTLFLVKDKEKRDGLLKVFTKGCYVVITEASTILDARDENMDDHWRVCRGMEGHAMFTPALGHSAISVQKRFNTLENFIMEWVEYSAAGQGTFVNTGLINVNALRQQRRAPGMLYPVRLPAGQSLANAVHTDQPPSIPADIFRHATDLTQLMQNLTGAVPTVSGGTEQSLKPTTYLADREQALGKMFVPWQHLRQFWAEIMWLGVKLFAENRTDDEKYSLPGMTESETINRTVRLEALQGEFDAYPEVNEQFPRLWHQQQALLMQFLQSADPVIQQILGNTRNLPYLKAMLGMPKIYVPSEDDHSKQELEIAQLLTGQPIPIPQIDPATGAQMGITLAPSFPPDEFEDDHLEHMNTVKQWAVSPVGVRLKTENPGGYRNVIAHGKAHYELMVKNAVQQGQIAALGAGKMPGSLAGPPAASPAGEK